MESSKVNEVRSVSASSMAKWIGGANELEQLSLGTLPGNDKQQETRPETKEEMETRRKNVLLSENVLS